MGGAGSGSWPRSDTRHTTDDCLMLSVNQLARDNLLHSNAQGILNWKCQVVGFRLATIESSIAFECVGSELFDITYRWNESMDVQTSIPLQTTQPHFGGYRWWFTCPMKIDGKACNRRVGKLYLRGPFFGCRHCHQLTYQSCQSQRLFKRIGNQLRGLTMSRL